MANPYEQQRWREAVNEDREETHETGDVGPHDRSAGNSRVRGDEWRREHDIDESQGDQNRNAGENDQHHHHHHHHHERGHDTGPDYERLAEEAHSRTRGHGDEGDRGSGLASQQGHDFGGSDSEHTNRHGTRGSDDLGTSRSPRTGSNSGQSGENRGLSSHREQGQQQGDDRRYGQRREQRGTESHQYGTVQEGSQRGSHREEGIAGRMTGQRGQTTHHANPSDSTFRDETMGEREHRHGGERGTSQRGRRFGSRRGHGSERHTEQRPSSQ